MHAVILIAPDGASGALRGLMDRLASVGVTVTIVDEIATAVEMSGRHARPPAVMLDLRDVGAGEVEDVRKATEAVRRTLAALPHALPIVVTTEAQAPLIVACMRSGAGDVIDLALEGTATARSVVLRICQRQAERSRELEAAEQQRTLIEDLLKDLIQTERRVIDAEEMIAARAGATGRTTREITAVEARPPAVLLVESDRMVADELADLLEAAGLATFAYVSGEEALNAAGGLAATSGLDLALVAATLPGMDGLETVRRLREQIAELPAFLLTSAEDGDLTEDATELGVVGIVQKPLTHVDTAVEQLAELARESLHRARESRYLQRIKERHERVLARYRSLPRAP